MMATVIDYITGEKIICSDLGKAIEIAVQRCENHNKEYYYRRGKHYPEGAVYYVLDDEVIIKRKEQ